MITDTGNRTEFVKNGAVRDYSPEAKGMPSLMPLDIWAEWDNDNVFYLFEKLKKHLEAEETAKAVEVIHTIQKGFRNRAYKDRTTCIIELSKHFYEGMKKYNKDNWKKEGIPFSSYIDSMTRHYIKWVDGITDESHDRAFLWNLMCLEWSIKAGYYEKHNMDENKQR